MIRPLFTEMKPLPPQWAMCTHAAAEKIVNAGSVRASGCKDSRSAGLDCAAQITRHRVHRVEHLHQIGILWIGVEDGDIGRRGKAVP